MKNNATGSFGLFLTATATAILLFYSVRASDRLRPDVPRFCYAEVLTCMDGSGNMGTYIVCDVTGVGGVCTCGDATACVMNSD